MGNASTLQLLTELEKEIDMHMQDLDCYDSIETNVVINESKPILAEVRKRNREEKLFKEKIENQEKQRKKQEEKNAKIFVKTGKPAMFRSEKKQVTRVKEVKKQETEEQVRLLLSIFILLCRLIIESIYKFDFYSFDVLF